MELKKINQLLSNIDYIDSRNEDLIFIERQDVHLGVTGNSYASEGVRGEEDSYYKIFKINSEENLFLRIEYFTDSYGDNESIRGVSFVKPTESKITVYESI